MLCHAVATAQATDTIDDRHRKFDYEQILSTHHWNLFICPSGRFSKPFHYSQQPDLDLRFRQSLGVEFGWMYQVNIKKHWGIRTGLALDMDWTNLGFNISGDYIGYGYAHDHKLIDAQEFISLPIYATYKLPIHDKMNAWMAQFEAGADLKYGGRLYNSGYTASQVDATGAIHQLFDFELYATRGFYPYFHLAAGMQYILPNKKLLELNLIGTLAPLYSQTATYSFARGSSREVDGQFVRRYCYLGFQLNYIFTRVRHMKPARSGYRIKPIKEL